MRPVTSKEILQVHDRIIEAIGGSSGVRERGLLVAVAQKPQASFGGDDLYPSLCDKATALFEAICNYHVFVDGNKRTAITVLELFLYRNEYKLIATKSQKEKFTLQTASSKPDLDKLAIWIKKHAKQI